MGLSDDLPRSRHDVLEVEKLRSLALGLGNAALDFLDPRGLDFLPCALLRGELDLQETKKLHPLFGRKLARLLDDGSNSLVHGASLSRAPPFPTTACTSPGIAKSSGMPPSPSRCSARPKAGCAVSTANGTAKR